MVRFLVFLSVYVAVKRKGLIAYCIPRQCCNFRISFMLSSKQQMRVILIVKKILFYVMQKGYPGLVIQDT